MTAALAPTAGDPGGGTEAGVPVPHGVMIRPPPMAVPAAIAQAQASLTQSVPIAATPKQMIGDRMPGAITEDRTPWNFTSPEPSVTIVAPMIPPIRVTSV